MESAPSAANTICPQKSYKSGCGLAALIILIAGILFYTIPVHPVLADTHTWTGNGDGTWKSGANWEGGVIPGVNDSLYFGSAGRIPRWPDNNFTSGTTFGSIYFDADGYFLYDSSIGLNGGISNYAGNNTIDFGIAMKGTTTSVDVAGGTKLTINGSLSGAGKILSKSGDGILLLTAGNSYSGETRISAGTVQITDWGAVYNSKLSFSGGTLDASGLTFGTSSPLFVGTGGTGTILMGSGSLTFDQNDSFGPSMTGEGGQFTKQGTGTMSVMGTQSYTGGTKITGGTLKTSANNVMPDTGTMHVWSGVYDLWFSSDTIGDLVIETGGKMTSSYTTSAVPIMLHAESLSGSGNIESPVVQLSLYTGSDNTDTTYTGRISGNASVYKEGTGTLTLSGSHTFTGNTYIDAGVLAVNGSIGGNVNVNDGGTLSGTGSLLSTTTVYRGGILAPGASPGTETFSNLIWDSGGHYLWEIDKLAADGGMPGSDPGWDLISISGDLTINATHADPYFIDLKTLSHPGHAYDDLANFNKNNPYSWLIAEITGTGNILYADSLWWDVDPTYFKNEIIPGSFSIRVTDDHKQMFLDYMPGGADVPEPSTLFLLLPFIGFGLRKLRRNVK